MSSSPAWYTLSRRAATCWLAFEGLDAAAVTRGIPGHGTGKVPGVLVPGVLVPGVLALPAFFFGARLVSLVRFFGGMVSSSGTKICHWQRISEVEYSVISKEKYKQAKL